MNCLIVLNQSKIERVLLLMARKTTAKKLTQLQSQILKLEQEKKELETQIHLEIGDYVVSKLGTNDVEEVKKKIDSFVEYDLSHTDNNDLMRSEDSPDYSTQPNGS